MDFRTGYGFDVHRLTAGESLWLGGISIPHEKGTIAHSDGDVLIHAICDALLGALHLGDIGTHFPDSDPAFRNVDSKILLSLICNLIRQEQYSIINIDSVICAEKPKLRPFIPLMEETLAKVMNIEAGRISVKATTTEKLGYEGREEGISAHAVALVMKG